MLGDIIFEIETFLGYQRDVGNVNALQMMLRTIIIYAVTLVLIRLASKRFLSQATAFDVIVGIMLGSVMSRAINSSASLFPTIAAGLVFVGLHGILAFVASRTEFGAAVKGKPVLLIKDGQVQQQGLWKAGLSARDLDQALRMQGSEPDPSKVKRAYLERSGSISVIPFSSEPQIVDVAVMDGVQTVRIKLN